MGTISSASTVFAQAYLTELGRKYIFNSEKNPRYVSAIDENGNATTIDKLQITRFSLGDPDMNYDLSSRLSSGDIPDLTGENENAITGAKGRHLNNLIAPGESDFTIGTIAAYYTLPALPMDINVDNLNAFISQDSNNSRELFLYIDGKNQNILPQHGIFNIFPTNYSKTVTYSDGIYTILLKKATTTEAGYRIAIYPPLDTYGVSVWDKVTVRIEKMPALGVVSINLSETTSNTASNLVSPLIANTSGTFGTVGSQSGNVILT
jgi:hypothetical protein